MRHYLLGLASVLSTALSASAYAQVDQIVTYHNCTGSDPASNEVYVYTNPNFGGTCAALYQGFYPTSSTGTGGFGLPNDSLSSLKVGPSVRARIFVDGVYGGNWTQFSGLNYVATMPSGWDNVVSSLRVENNSRTVNCSDLRTGEFALFRNANFGDDCVVLYYGHTYPAQANMGIANDSVSSVNGGPAYSTCSNGGTYTLILYQNANYGGSQFQVSAGTANSFLSTFNDATSAVGTVQFCIN